MEFIDNFFDICDRLQSCNSIEEVETLKRNLKHSGKNPKLGKSRIPSVDELTKQVVGLIGEVNELAALGKNGIFHSVSVPAPPLPIGSVNNENEFDFESRMSIFNEIMEAIKDDGAKMIGIWGMPGIGKTTLVKRAAKYARDEGLFEEVAMAVVSQNPSVKAIQGQIADMIGLKLTGENEEGRAGQLLQMLVARKKPILIILDDIWDSIELNTIGIPSGSQHKGCKIILTSRILDVCEQMRTQKNFEIDLLSSNEALHLFLQMSGVDDQSSEKGRLAEKLSEECGRLPISTVIVARGLLNKRKVSWENMLNRLRKSDPDRKMYATIKLSFDHLNCEEEKMFFLLCAVFPEDYNIPVQVLLEYGLGLDLFEKVDKVDEAVVRAQNLALRLKSQCLLLDEGDKNFVKMHDVIRDVALAIASEGKHAFLVPEETTKSFRYEDFKKLPNELDCAQLQILMLHSSQQYFQLNDNFFNRMKNLIVLHISFVRFVQLPQSFTALENLRTLRFSYCNLRDISTIGKLQTLVCLSFYGSYFQVFPKEIGELSNLRLLDFSNCECSNGITPGVFQNLSQLEALRVGTGIQWRDEKEVCHLENASLSKSIHLSSSLKIIEIWIPNTSMLPDDVLLGNLSKFNVSIGEDGPNWQHIFFSNSQILKLTRLSKKELLKAGIKMLMKKAQRLVLEDISGLSIALPSNLWGYGSLEELIIERCYDVNYVLDVGESEYESETSCLQLLHLIHQCLSKEQDDVIVFPQLRHLKLSELENLTSFVSKFTLESTLFGKQVIFSALETLDINNLEKLEKIWHTHTPVQSFFQLKVLKLTRCAGLLVVFPPQATSALQNLEEICIENCHKLETLFQLDDVCLTESNEMVLFPRLLTLKLVNLLKFTAILSTTSQNISKATVIFSATKIMTPCKLHNFESMLDQQLLAFFPKLKKLELEGIGCPSSTADSLHIIKWLEALEELMIKNNNGKTLPQVIQTLPKLRKLQLGFIHEPIELCERLNRCGVFQNLTSLNFFSCNGVKSLLRPSIFSCLVQLEELFVSECETMESIVGETSRKQSFDKVIEFSKLRTLRLGNLPHLTSFYNRGCALKFPCLGNLVIKDCPKLKTLASMSRETLEPSYQNFVPKETLFLFGPQVSFGRLHHLVLERLESMEEIWHRGHSATTVGELIHLSVKGCDRLLKLFPSNILTGLKNLKKLVVGSCRSLEQVFEVQDHPPLLSNLCDLEFYDLPELKHQCLNKNTKFWPSRSRASFLGIDTCPPSVANRLENLENLSVESSSIVAILPDPELHSLEISTFPPSVANCLENLENLSIESSSTVTILPDSELHSLEIDTFPSSVANRLENLENLSIESSSTVTILPDPELHSLEIDTLPPPDANRLENLENLSVESSSTITILPDPELHSLEIDTLPPPDANRFENIENLFVESSSVVTALFGKSFKRMEFPESMRSSFGEFLLQYESTDI